MDEYYDYMYAINNCEIDLPTYILYLIGDNYLKDVKISNNKYHDIIINLVKKELNLVTNLLNSYIFLEKFVKAEVKDQKTVKQFKTKGKQSYLNTDMVIPSIKVMAGGDTLQRNLDLIVDRGYIDQTSPVFIHIENMFKEICGGSHFPCNYDGLYGKLNIPVNRDRGHWLNTPLEIEPNPLSDISPSPYTNISGYLWTINKCGKDDKNLYGHITNILRTHDMGGYNNFRYFLKGLYYCILTSKRVELLSLRIGGHSPVEIQTLWRGENRVYTPVILNLPSNMVGNVKWRDITILQDGKYVLNPQNNNVGYKGVFKGFTATSDDISLAGYFCTSRNWEDTIKEYVQVMYNFRNISEEYSGWIYELQAFKERENLCLPGLVYTVEKIEYKHYDDALQFWSEPGNRPKSAGNVVDDISLKRPLLLITLKVEGVSGYLPGLSDQELTNINKLLHPSLAELPEPSESSEENSVLSNTTRYIVNTMGLNQHKLMLITGIILASYGLTGGGKKEDELSIQIKYLMNNIKKVGDFIKQEALRIM